MKININKLCSWMVVLFMPLSLYGTMLPNITIGDIGLILLMLIVIMVISIKKIKIKEFLSKEILLYIVLIIINSLIQAIIDVESIINGIYSLMRYLVFMLFVMIVPRFFLDKQYTYKIYERMGIIFAIYSLMQFVSFYVFKHILPISILPFKTSTDLSIIQNISRYSNGRVLFRPYSVFIEPSYFAIYESYLLYWILNAKKDKTSKDIIGIILITVAMIISGTTGIAMLAIVYGKKMCELSKRDMLKTIGFVGMIIILLIIFLNTSYGSRILKRIFNDGDMGYSTEGRLGNLKTLIEQKDIFLIGKGIWIEYDYLPSVGRILIGLGIIGVIFFIFIMYLILKRTNNTGSFFTLMFLISLVATNSLFNITSVLVFSLIIMNYKKEEERNEKNRISNLV